MTAPIPVNSSYTTRLPVGGRYWDRTSGVVASQPGLYFCGLFFLHALWSETLSGMPIDAEFIADRLVARKQEALTG